MNQIIREIEAEQLKDKVDEFNVEIGRASCRDRV